MRFPVRLHYLPSFPWRELKTTSEWDQKLHKLICQIMALELLAPERSTSEICEGPALWSKPWLQVGPASSWVQEVLEGKSVQLQPSEIREAFFASYAFFMGLVKIKLLLEPCTYRALFKAKVRETAKANYKNWAFEIACPAWTSFPKSYDGTLSVLCSKVFQACDANYSSSPYHASNICDANVFFRSILFVLGKRQYPPGFVGLGEWWIELSTNLAERIYGSDKSTLPPQSLFPQCHGFNPSSVGSLLFRDALVEANNLLSIKSEQGLESAWRALKSDLDLQIVDLYGSALQAHRRKWSSLAYWKLFYSSAAEALSLAAVDRDTRECYNPLVCHQSVSIKPKVNGRSCGRAALNLYLKYEMPTVGALLHAAVKDRDFLNEAWSYADPYCTQGEIKP